MINIAVLGYGTVGSGVVEILEKNSDVISRKANNDVYVKYVLDLRDFENDKIQDRIVHDFDIILNDPEIRIVVEAMGGVEPAYTYSKKSIMAGKSVVTSNKALVAKHGSELLRLAHENKLNYFFEASVGGGIPIIRPLYSSLTADHIQEITGIMNGTTNYILTKMFDEGAQFDDVLSQAQALGYAEKNPEADVEGYDAGRKICILSSLANDKFINFEDIYTEGITKISSEDFLYIKKMGMNVKLLASAKWQSQGVYVFVAPFLLNNTHPLFNVHDVFNAIYVKSDMLGETMYYGRGAGKLPTASAIISDIIDEIRHFNVSINMNLPAEREILPSFTEFECPFFVRIKKSDLTEAEKYFDIQEVIEAGINDEIGLITAKMSQAAFEKAADNIKIIARIRING